MVSSRTPNRRAKIAFAILMVTLVGVAIVSVPLALTVAPAVLWLGLVALGVRPGERLIERLLRRRTDRSADAVAVLDPRLPVLVRRTGRLLASALAMRPPPRSNVVSS